MGRIYLIKGETIMPFQNLNLDRFRFGDLLAFAKQLDSFIGTLPKIGVLNGITGGLFGNGYSLSDIVAIAKQLDGLMGALPKNVWMGGPPNIGLGLPPNLYFKGPVSFPFVGNAPYSFYYGGDPNHFFDLANQFYPFV